MPPLSATQQGRLRSARLAAGMSVAELAHQANVAITTVYRIEAGAHELRSMRVARALADALDVPVADLFGGAA